ncbi:MAG: hypothetical protein ACI8TP_001590 [Acidimicrobiales bacterium]|jgi:hypothetical protein
MVSLSNMSAGLAGVRCVQDQGVCPERSPARGGDPFFHDKTDGDRDGLVELVAELVGEVLDGGHTVGGADDDGGHEVAFDSSAHEPVLGIIGEPVVEGALDGGLLERVRSDLGTVEKECSEYQDGGGAGDADGRSDAMLVLCGPGDR